MSGMQAGSSGFIATNFDIIVDTGTNGGNVPRWVADEYFTNFPGSSFNSDWGTYQYPCSQQLIDLSFEAGGQLLTIPASYLGNGCINSACNICISQLFTTTGTALWGRPFLEALFVVFDWGNGKVGFAKKASN
jgi:Eukaryotic aspartyl protease